MTLQEDLLRAPARLKSYTSQAALVFFLYWLFFIPGLVVNLLFYLEAKRMEQTAGQPLPGVTCLFAMLVFGIGVLTLTVLALRLQSVRTGLSENYWIYGATISESMNCICSGRTTPQRTIWRMQRQGWRKPGS